MLGESHIFITPHVHCITFSIAINFIPYYSSINNFFLKLLTKMKLTGGAVKINIAAFKCFKFSVFLSSSSNSSVMVIWIEDCLGVSVLLTAPLETCDVERRKGHEEAMTLCTRLLIFISFTLPWLR